MSFRKKIVNRGILFPFATEKLELDNISPVAIKYNVHMGLFHQCKSQANWLYSTDYTSVIGPQETGNRELDGSESDFLSRYFLILKRVQNNKVCPSFLRAYATPWTVWILLSG